MPRGVSVSNLKIRSGFDSFDFGVVKSKVLAFFSVSASRLPFASVAAKTYTAKSAGVVAGDAPIPAVGRLANVAKVANPIVINSAVDVIYDVRPLSKLDDPRDAMSKINSVVDFGVEISTSVFRGKGLLVGKPSVPLVGPCLFSVFVAFKRTDWAAFPKKKPSVRVIFEYGFQKILRNLGGWHSDLSTLMFGLFDNISSARGCKHA